MIRAGYGQSTNQDTVSAFTEAVESSLAPLGAEEPEIILLFASGGHSRLIEDGLASAIKSGGTDRIVGCSGAGVLSIRSEVEQQNGVVSLAMGGSDVEAIPFLVEAEEAANQLETLLLPYINDAGLLCLFPTIATGHPGEIVERLSDAVPFPIVGGAASGSPLDPRSFQWLGSNVRTDSVSGVLLRGEFDILTGVAQGCQPFGQAYTVTKSERNIIHELAFTPAVDALKESLDHLTPEQKENVGPSIFVGIAMDEHDSERKRGDFLIRNLIGMNPENGSIAVGETLEVGQTIQFNLRTSEAAHLDLEQTTRAVREELEGRDPVLGMYFNCLGRGFGLYGRPSHDVDLIRRDLGEFPLVGFFGNAEFAPVAGQNFVHSYTGGLVVFTTHEDMASD